MIYVNDTRMKSAMTQGNGKSGKMKREDKQMGKRFKTRFICLIVSGVLLSSTLVVSALNGSPYETLKNAVFNVFTYESFKMDGEFTFKIDGRKIESETIRILASENGYIEFENDGFVSFAYDDLIIRRSYSAQDGTQWYSATINSWNSHHNIFPRMTHEDRNSASFRFAELFIDILVGDLKNNIYMTSNGGVRRISGAITHNQLPELVRVGIEMMIENDRRWRAGNYGVREDYRCPSEIPMESLTFNHIGGEANIDNMGNLTYLNISVIASVVNVFGDHHVFEISVRANFSDINETTIEIPILGAREFFTPEFIESITGRRYNTVHFTLEEDGSINAGSVIDTWPGNLRNQENFDANAGLCQDEGCVL